MTYFTYRRSAATTTAVTVVCHRVLAGAMGGYPRGHRMTLDDQQTAALNTLARHDALDCAEALGLTDYEGGISRRGTSAVLIRVTRVPADWSATVTQVQVGLR